MHWATGIPTTAISSPLPSRRDIYIYIMPVPRLRFEERETGPKR